MAVKCVVRRGKEQEEGKDTQYEGEEGVVTEEQ